MKRIILFALCCLLLSAPTFSQRFVGYNTGNYAGITGVMLQPASIVDSRFKFDINLFSTDVGYSNNYFLLNRDALLKFNKNNFDDYETFKSRYLSEAQLAAGEKAFFNISNRTQLPLSFMVNLGEKSALALNIQSRTMIQGRNIGQDLAKLAFNNFYHQPFNNRPIDASNLTMQSLSWAEVGLTYGRVLVNSGNHFLKGAVTGKYLGGVSSFYLGSNNLTVRVNNDSTFNFNTDRVNYNHNKNADLSRVFDTRFRPDANAFGADAGLVYEFRGNFDKFKYIRNDDEESYEVKRTDLNKYIFRFGVSLLDVGMFTFNKPANANSFRADINNWDIRNANYNSLADFDTALRNRVTPLGNDPREYNVYLPGALSLQMDIRFVKGLYLNALAYRPLKVGSKSGSRFDNYGYYSITPRFERRHFGIYLPYTFSDKNDISDFKDNRLGMAIKLGPVFFGSSNLGSMAFNKNLKAADFFVGVKVGFTYGKPSKIERLLRADKSTGTTGANYKKIESDSTETTLSIRQDSSTDRRVLVSNIDTATKRIIVDYTKGQIYSDGKSGQVIIINNNYYYGTTRNGADSLYNQQLLSGKAQATNYNVDSAVRTTQVQKKRVDSTNNVLGDSLSQKRQQLDTLINRLNKLRQQLDSTTAADSATSFKLKQAIPVLASDTVISANTQTASSKRANNSHSDTTVTKNALAVNAAKENAVFVDSMTNDRTVIVRTQADSSVRATAKVADSTLMADTIDLAAQSTSKSDSIKKKATTTSVKADEQETKVSTVTVKPTDNAALVAANNRAIKEQQDLRGDYYENYRRQSERLQADIERLERQMANNRSIAYNSAPQRNNVQPVYIREVQQTPVPVQAIVPLTDTVERTLIVRDTVRIRDTVFLQAKAVFTPKPQPETKTVYVPVTKTEIVKEKIDYANYPAENILFGVNKATVSKVYFQKLDYLSNILVNNADLQISITGHTDKTGSQAINELLSFKRATAVKKYFLQKGISSKRMQLTAVAAEDPLVVGNTKSAQMQNRRVEVKILP